MKSIELSKNDNYSSECDANDLIRVGEIVADPKRLAAANKILSAKKEVISTLDDLFKLRERIPEDEDVESKEAKIKSKSKSKEVKDYGNEEEEEEE